jgi:hypothetical protein
MCCNASAAILWISAKSCGAGAGAGCPECCPRRSQRAMPAGASKGRLDRRNCERLEWRLCGSFRGSDPAGLSALRALGAERGLQENSSAHVDDALRGHRGATAGVSAARPRPRRAAHRRICQRSWPGVWPYANREPRGSGCDFAAWLNGASQLPPRCRHCLKKMRHTARVASARWTPSPHREWKCCAGCSSGRRTHWSLPWSPYYLRVALRSLAIFRGGVHWRRRAARGSDDPQQML